MELEKRIRMAAESILENESLRDGLEDAGASALMDWGIARAKQIAAESAYLEDETEAEEGMYPRMRALRQMLHTVASLYGDSPEAGQRDSALQELAGLVAVVYGLEVPPPGAADWAAFMAAQSGSTGEKINAFRALIENNLNTEEGD